jgi:hypothetical protein
MFVKFTETKSNTVILLNTDNIVAVFEAAEGDLQGKTVINVVNGAVVVEESLITVMGQLAAV